MSDSLEARGAALEDEFFHKDDQKKIAALKEKLESQTSKDALRKASGMTDEAVLDKLVELGLTANTIAALSLVPLIAVAWADGTMQPNERNAILQGAAGKGIEDGSDAYTLLSAWLDRQPGDALLDTWMGYIKALADQLTLEQSKLLRNQIVGFAKMVANSAGGILGFAKVSGSEEKVLAKIESAFAR